MQIRLNGYFPCSTTFCVTRSCPSCGRVGTLLLDIAALMSVKCGFFEASLLMRHDLASALTALPMSNANEKAKRSVVLIFFIIIIVFVL